MFENQTAGFAQFRQTLGGRRGMALDDLAAACMLPRFRMQNWRSLMKPRG
jgi:hypothetical protein